MIKRYDLILDPQTACFCDVVEDDTGEYVAFEDHEKAVAKLQAQVDRFPAQLRRIAKEIQDEGHLGWGNELNDIAAAIKGEDS